MSDKIQYQIEKVFSKILDFIANTARSTNETELRLSSYLDNSDLQDAEKEQVHAVIMKRLHENNLLNDVQYAKEVVFTFQHSSKPRGIEYIKRFLTKKGISQKIIYESTENLVEDDDFEKALNYGEKKLKTIKFKNNYEAKQKIWSALLRRGFSPNIIGRVIDNILGVK